MCEVIDEHQNRLDTLDDRLAKEFKSIKDRLNELEERIN